MNIRIKSITPVPDKGLVWVTLILCGESAGQYQKEKYPLLCSQLAALGLAVGETDAETAERIADASGICRAYLRGLSSLSYGDRSARELTYRLVQKGSDRAHAEAAVAMLIEAGYLRESSAALREAEKGVARLHSRRRVEYDLRAKGYDAGEAEVQAYLDGVDFVGSCRLLLARECRHGLPEGEARKKLNQKMLMRGFAPAELREAFETLAEQEDATEEI